MAPVSGRLSGTARPSRLSGRRLVQQRPVLLDRAVFTDGKVRGAQRRRVANRLRDLAQRLLRDVQYNGAHRLPAAPDIVVGIGYRSPDGATTGALGQRTRYS